ncbi:MAG: Cell division coordinator CpoB [Desulfovibrio sp.]
MFRVLLALIFMLGFWAHDGVAATVRFEVLPDRERLTVSLSQEEGFAGDVRRVDATGLLLDLGVPTGGMARDLAPENAKLFRYTEPRGRALGIFMQTAAFGYVVSRPDNFTVIINAYADPLGERWQPEGAPPQSASGSGTSSVTVAEPPVSPGETAAQNASSSASDPDADMSTVRGVIEKRPGKTSQAFPPGSSADALSGPPAIVTAQTFRARINPGSLSDWQDMHPEDVPAVPSGSSDSSGAASSAGSSSGGSSSGAPGGETPGGKTPGTADTGTAPAPEKVYVDDKGNPIPPPPDPVEAIAEVRRELASGNFPGALEKVTALLTHPELTSEQTEEVLHLNSEALFLAHQNALAANFDAIVSATITAMNYNTESPRNAAAYLRLGYLNLKMGNTVEADAYFTRMRRQYPLDENIALTYYYWGQYYYDKGEMQAAADEFQYIISNFSESKYARDAALGLARSYVALGYYQEAFDIIEYVQRRWAQLYLEAPAVLELMGDVGYRVGNLDFALDKYMIYYNLMPNGPTADVILTRIGDVYARKRQLRAATAAYEEAERRFPDKDGGLVAMMRLAEVGIHDTPALQEMLTLFHDQKGRKTFRAADIYKKIIAEHPTSDLAPLAMLKLAMWNLAQARYEDALKLCTDLVKRYPKHELVPRAEEVAMRAFDALAAEGATQNRAGQVIASWSENPILQKQAQALSPESRVALALSMYKQNDPDGALHTVSPMFLGRKDPNWAEQALQLALMINLDHDRWEAIEKLSEQVSMWELTAKAKNQLDYAVALSRENLGKSAEAAPLWERLAQSGSLSEKEQAYAEFFLAKDAEHKRKLQDAYTFGRSSLSRFLTLAQQNPDQADTGKINSLLSSLIDICETSGRLNEALEYANRYMASLPESSSQRQGMLFRIAGIYKKQGNTPEWRKTLTELAQKYPDSVHGRAAASTLRSAQLSEDAAQFSPSGSL